MRGQLLLVALQRDVCQVRIGLKLRQLGIVVVGPQPQQNRAGCYGLSGFEGDLIDHAGDLGGEIGAF